MTEEVLQDSCRLLGTVLAVQANYYRVRLDSDGEMASLGDGENTRLNSSHSSLLLCTRRTRLKKIGQQVMVGDRVLVEEPDWTGQRGAIADVLPRKISWIVRRSLMSIKFFWYLPLLIRL